MTPAAQHKRAERQRRREAGEVRVEVVLPKDAMADLDALKGRWSMQSRSEVIVHAMRIALRDNHVEVASSANEIVLDDANLRWIRRHLA